MFAKKYAIFCLLLIAAMAVANRYGVIYSNYFANQQAQANRFANNYHK